MLVIKGLSANACIISGTCENVVDVKFKDKSFEGSISWNELLVIIKRKSVISTNDGQTAALDDKRESEKSVDSRVRRHERHEGQL